MASEYKTNNSIEYIANKKKTLRNYNDEVTE